MRTLQFDLTFHTPAFLGDATQAGRWRTPPFKALLRQWWRVAYAAEHGVAVNVVEKMRRAEGALFGHAWLDDDRDAGGAKVAARRSEVRVRLDRWDIGELKAWQPTNKPVDHEEVKFPIGSDLYLGYGPITLKQGDRVPSLKSSAAIQAGEKAVLSLALPESHAGLVERALAWMHGYGTVGGRSRNGWGSLSLRGKDDASAGVLNASPALRRWRDALKSDWPHALGNDDQGALIWHTPERADWAAVMQDLARAKIALRTRFKFPSEQPPHRQVEDRHWLAYPITRHRTSAWKADARLPNSLRFKVRPTSSGKLVGVIFHMPCLPPPEFQPRLVAIERVWREVHACLDAHPGLTRAPF